MPPIPVDLQNDLITVRANALELANSITAFLSHANHPAYPVFPIDHDPATCDGPICVEARARGVSNDFLRSFAAHMSTRL